jgi:hypothetical protein
VDLILEAIAAAEAIISSAGRSSKAPPVNLFSRMFPFSLLSDAASNWAGVSTFMEFGCNPTGLLRRPGFNFATHFPNMQIYQVFVLLVILVQKNLNLQY